MATTAQHIAARDDRDLVERLVAAAEIAGIPRADVWVTNNVGRLIAADVADGQTVADVHAYADTVRTQALANVPPPPGLDPAAVTDTHLATAVTTVRSETAQ